MRVLYTYVQVEWGNTLSQILKLFYPIEKNDMRNHNHPKIIMNEHFIWVGIYFGLGDKTSWNSRGICPRAILCISECLILFTYIPKWMYAVNGPVPMQFLGRSRSLFSSPKQLGPVSIWRPSFPGMVIPVLKIRQYETILSLTWGHVFIETTPWWVVDLSVRAKPAWSPIWKSVSLYHLCAKHKIGLSPTIMFFVFSYNSSQDADCTLTQTGCNFGQHCACWWPSTSWC